MKISSVFVLVLLLLAECSTKKHYEYRELLGVYGVRVCPDCYYKDGWEIGISDSVQLTLLEDSSYEEIHLSYAAFEFVSYWGRWEFRNDSILLTPLGELDWSNGKYYRLVADSTVVDTTGCNSLKYLEIINDNSLKSNGACRFTDAILKRNP